MEYQFMELVREGKQGCLEAVQLLVNALQPLMRSVVKRYGWGMDREELLQEAALAVIEGVREYDETRGVPFLAFIRTKLSFHIYNLSRRQRVAYSLDVLMDDEDGQAFIDLLTDPGEGPLQAIIREDEQNGLREAVKALPDAQQRVIEMHYFQGASLKRIADVMGVSYKTVLRMKGRALLCLRKNLEKGVHFKDGPEIYRV